MLIYKIILPDSPHPVIVSKNPGFQTFYLARQNEFSFFHLINTKNIYYFIFGCWLLPKKFSFCPKNGFARVRGSCSPLLQKSFLLSTINIQPVSRISLELSIHLSIIYYADEAAVKNNTAHKIKTQQILTAKHIQ